jgi:hypothetical protein
MEVAVGRISDDSPAHVTISRNGWWRPGSTSFVHHLHTAKQTITMLGYVLGIVPLYFLIYLPASQMLYGTSQRSSNTKTADLAFNLSSIASDEPLSCPPHSYNTYILSHEPLIIYIENFLNAQESAHLLKIRYVVSSQTELPAL